jgi:hypothetical protein
LLLLQAIKYLIAHSTGTITPPRAMTGRQKKTGKPVSPQQKISTGIRGKRRKQILRSRLQQNEDKLCQRTK